MSNVELEQLALEVRRIAGLRAEDVAPAARIALAVLGAGAIRRAPGLRSEACLAIVGGRYRIVLREIGPDSNFAIAHELGHWALRELAHCAGAEEEQAANYVGAAILAPSSAFAAVRRSHPEDAWQPVARTFGLSQTSAGIRAHEVEGIPIAIVTVRGNQITRPTAAFSWDTVDLKAAAQRRRPKGLRKTLLRGGIDEGRVLLRPLLRASAAVPALISSDAGI